MANNTAHIDAGSDDVFALLLDASAYPAWVVGTRRLRGVDPEWPGPGACFHHAIGIGPFELRDSTRMLESDPPHRVVLEARFRPAGTARVTITVRPDGEGTEVELEEHPARGPVESIPGRVFDAATHLRNAIALRRLRRLAERRPASEAART